MHIKNKNKFKIDQFRYIKIQPKTKDFTARGSGE